MSGRFKTRPGNRAGLSPCRPDGNRPVAGKVFLLSTLLRRQREALCLCLAFWLALLSVLPAQTHAAPRIDQPAVLVTSNGSIASNTDVVSLLLGITWLRHDASLGSDTLVMPVRVNGGAAVLPGPLDSNGMPLMGSVNNPVATLLPLLAAGSTPLFANGEAVFFSAQYPSLANDPLVIDTVSVRVRIYSGTGSLLDEEVLQAFETGLDTGVFTGYFQNSASAGGAGDGLVRLPPGARVEIVDIDDLPDGVLDSQVDADISAAAPGTTTLFVSKRALQATASVGDFLQYEVTVDNGTTAIASNTLVRDILPRGFRYVPGSATLDGLPLADPARADDGLTLTFSLGTLAATQRAQLRYVTEVTAGARTGKAINAALASADGGVVSTTARATVTVEEDLYRSHAFLVGRVLADACGAEDTSTLGLANVRLFLEDGTTVLTDKLGRYHVAGIRPGTHVIQVDKESLPEDAVLEPCADNTRFAGNGFSQFVDLPGGGLGRADFHVRLPGPAETAPVQEAPAAGEPALGLRLTSTSDLGFIHYRAEISGENTPADKLLLVLDLDPTLQIVRGSLKRDGNEIALEKENGVRTIALGNEGGNWSTTIEFDAMSASDETRRTEAVVVDTEAWLALASAPADALAKTRNSVRLAQASGGDEVHMTVSTVFPPMSAELSPLDKLKLDDIVAKLRELEEPHLTVTGHTDNIPIRKSGKKKLPFASNEELSRARAQAVADYLAQRLALPAEVITVIGAGAEQPLTRNRSQEDRARNRRVDVAASSRTSREAGEIAVMLGDSGVQRHALAPAVMTATAPPMPAPVAEAPPPSAEKLVPGILDFQDGDHLAQRIQQVRVAMDHRLTARLTIDDVEVPASRIGYRGIDRKTNLVLLSYIGVDFGERGEHVLRITGTDTFGNKRLDKSVKLVRTGDVQDVRLVSVGDNVADGRTPVTLRVELLDEQRRVIPASASLVLLESDLQPESGDTGNPLARNDRSIKVDPDGTLRFKPVTQSGRYHVRLSWAEGRAEDFAVFVKPHFRDWILVGVAEGTAAYRDLSRNIVALTPEERDSGLATDARTALFARGKVSGSWLMTVAWDSEKADANGLADRIDPNGWYMLYGDNSQQSMDAPSQRKLYLKIERENFYALFGDFQSGLDNTELTRYQRRLNGVKSEYWGNRVEVLAFASETRQAYVRDEVRGDGTAGLYRLRHRGIVPQSEDVRIETRDRFRPDVVLATRRLTPFLDYSLDADDGSLWFKEPVRAQDDAFNPVWIVVEYEVDSGIDDVTGGVRVSGTPLAGLQVGATAVHEGMGGGDAALAGVDARYVLDEHNTFVAEIANSSSNLPAGGTSTTGATGDGAALLLAHEYRREALAVDTRVAQTDEGFGLGQQATGQDATRRLESRARYNLTEALELAGTVSRSEQLDIDRTRDLAEARVSLLHDDRDLFGGVRFAHDDSAAGERESQQLIGGVRQRFLDRRLQLKLEGETNVAEDELASVDYPHRLRVGADYRVSRKAQLFSEQEWGWGDGQDSEHTSAGVRYTPWTGAQANTSVGREANEFGPRVYANAGLVQNWQIDGRWTLDAGIDRVQTIEDPGTPAFDPDVAPTNGDFTEDFTALFLGAGYQDDAWRWRGRAETRDGHDTDKLNLFSSIYRDVDEATTLGNTLRYLQSDSRLTGTRQTSATLQLDYAWRPLDGPWVVLDQARHVIERRHDATDSLDGTRLVNNLVAHWRRTPHDEVSLQYGARYVFDTIDDRRYTGYTDLMGVEYRRDLSAHWDVGARTSLLHSWGPDAIDESWGLFAGFSPEKNVRISLGYNFKGFRDDDFTGANYRDQGINLGIRIKFDQDSVKALAPKRNKLKAPWPDAAPDTVE